MWPEKWTIVYDIPMEQFIKRIKDMAEILSRFLSDGKTSESFGELFHLSPDFYDFTK